ncbi:receptor-like protein kinase [Gossypium australe]|uniref:Receptor-like protein kinase n=1 Tax=Gossypium australe TaxID=47621 RepID=A0A5B6WX51_9ROSI|nr:receptor-like protein kinase [Gossypium australe]
MLRRYRSDPSHLILPSEIEIQPNMTYSVEPIRILAREVKQLRNKSFVTTTRCRRGYVGNRGSYEKTVP